MQRRIDLSRDKTGSPVQKSYPYASRCVFPLNAMRPGGHLINTAPNLNSSVRAIEIVAADLLW